jgi:hypothetical protein
VERNLTSRQAGALIGKAKKKLAELKKQAEADQSTPPAGDETQPDLPIDDPPPPEPTEGPPPDEDAPPPAAEGEGATEAEEKPPWEQPDPCTGALPDQAPEDDSIREPGEEG